MKNEQSGGTRLATDETLWRDTCRTPLDAFEKLATDGWTIIDSTDPDFGFDSDFLEHMNATYYGENGILKTETYDVFPPDRKRARGLVEVTFNERGEPILNDREPAPLINADRGHESETRVYEHIPFMGDAKFKKWLSALALLVPPRPETLPGAVLDEHGGLDVNALFSGSYTGNQLFYKILTGTVTPPDIIEDQSCHDIFTSPVAYDGLVDLQALRVLSGNHTLTVGVNLFEVYRDVVSGPHQDNAHWNAITVVDKEGEGAVSELYELDSDTPFLCRTLKPGQTLLVDDQRYRHSATKMQPTADGKCMRRTIVCTLDYAPALPSQSMR
jgi:hypothetical protein